MLRWVFALLVLVLASTGSQAADKVFRVGFLSATNSPAQAAMRDGISRSLEQRGFAPGKTFVIEARSAEGRPERLPGIAKEMAASGLDVIVTTGYPAARAAKDAQAVPVVAINVGEPVETGLAQSLSHPGGNLTGISDLSSELSAKRLELLTLAAPGIRRIAMLWNADDPGMTTRYRAAEAVAGKLGVAVQPLGVREPDDFDSAFGAMTREKPDAILMVTDVLTILNRKRVFEFAAANRIPAIYEFDLFARDGGLMSYGPDGQETTARLGDLVARVLKGAKPADLPFEQPTRFRFVINRKTAEALGLSIPESLLERADEVIE